MLKPSPISPLFPYTTLFRSKLSLLLASTRFEQERARRHRHRVRLKTFILNLIDTSYERMLGKLSTRMRDRKSTRLNSSHLGISYAVFCLKKKINTINTLLKY